MGSTPIVPGPHQRPVDGLFQREVPGHTLILIPRGHLERDVAGVRRGLLVAKTVARADDRIGEDV
jgi:hypothetical protein